MLDRGMEERLLEGVVMVEPLRAVVVSDGGAEDGGVPGGLVEGEC